MRGDYYLSRLYDSLRAKGTSKASALRIVSQVQARKAGRATPTAEAGEIAAPKTQTRDDGGVKAVIEACQSAASKGEGYRVGVIGESGGGKTSLLRALLDAMPFDGLTLIHDEKPGKATQYAGLRSPYVQTDRVGLGHLHRRDVGTVIFRGDPMRGTVTTAHDVALLAVELGRKQVPVRLVIDELDSATTDGGMRLASTAVRFCLTQGRAVNISVLCSTQLPVRMPSEVIDNLTVLVATRCGPRSLQYLRNRAFFDDAVVEALGRLRAHYEDGAPGELVVLRAGRDWDGRVLRNA